MRMLSAALESSAEKTIPDLISLGSQARTVMPATRDGIASPPIQRAASAYGFPADRSEAAISASSNHG